MRRALLEECDLQAIITMPSGVFKPYAGVGTAVLVFQKGSKTESVWFYEMSADGFSLSDTRTPVAENDIPDILVQWPKREEGPHSFRVSINDLARQGYLLSPSLYRSKPAEETDHDEPSAILADVIHIEEALIERMRTLARHLDNQ